MKLFPLFANLAQRPVLVVGGGDIAERKIRLLTAAGAEVHVLAPDFCDAVLRLEHSKGVYLHQGVFEPARLDDKWFAVAATNNREVNRQVAQAAAERRILVNVVDDGELSTSHMPAIIDRSPITIAISSAGSAPMVARWVRERVEALFDGSIEKLAQLAQKHRRRICSARPQLGARRHFFEWMMNGTVAADVRANRLKQAEQTLLAALERETELSCGQVTLVEAGANLPGLLTLDALRALNCADLIVYDKTIDPDILDLARRDAKRIELPQENTVPDSVCRQTLQALLQKHATAGESVVLLCSGNAFSMGNASSDLSFLAERDIPFSIIPGVSRLAAAAAYAAIPLAGENGDHTISYTPQPCLPENISADQTVFMREEGETLAKEIQAIDLSSYCASLIAGGVPENTPCAVILSYGKAGQCIQSGTLLTVPELVHGTAAPTESTLLVITGAAVTAAPHLAWFGHHSEQTATDYAWTHPNATDNLSDEKNQDS